MTYAYEYTRTLVYRGTVEADNPQQALHLAKLAPCTEPVFEQDSECNVDVVPVEERTAA